MAWLALLLATAAPTGATGPAGSPTQDAKARVVQIGGRERSYRLFAPAGLDRSVPVPLILVFHGAGSRAEEIERLTDFDRLARRYGFLVLYPQGVYRNWNDGRGAWSSLAHLDNVNDLAFVDTLVRLVRDEYPIDTDRIFAAGLSNGGGFAHFLAANRPDLIAAIGTVAGSVAQPLAERFRPESPVSVLMIHGLDDPITPISGGGVLKGVRGRVIGATESAKLWSRANGCPAEPDSGMLEDRDPDDGCQTHWYRWRNDTTGTDVTLFLVEGMGHTWPGQQPYLAERFIGRSTFDFDASMVMWQFFREHPRQTRRDQ